MAKKKKQLSEAEREKQEELLGEALEAFYYDVNNGLGMVDEWHSPKKSKDELVRAFRDSEGNSFTSVEELFDAIYQEKPVFAYKCGETEPFKVKYENHSLSLGTSIINLGDRPAAPGFLNRFLSIFGNKKARAVCQRYDQYMEDLQYKAVYDRDSTKNLRARNAEKEKINKKYVEAPAKHEDQKKKIIGQRVREANNNSLEYFDSPNRWERMSFEEFCFEVSKEYRASRLELNDYSKQEIREKGKDDFTFDEVKEMQKEGQNIIKNVIENEQYAIFEAMVGKFVSHQTTDLEERNLKDFFELSYVEIYDRTAVNYPGVNLQAVANPKVQFNEVVLFNQNAQFFYEMPNEYTGYALNDTKAMLAIASHKMTFGNMSVNQKDTSLGKIGAKLIDYQEVHNRIISADSGDELSFKIGELRTIAYLHLIKQSLIKQDGPGENEIQALIANESVMNYSLDTSYKNRSRKAGTEIINDVIESYYIDKTLKDNNIVPNCNVKKEDIAHFIGDKNNYRLVAQSLRDGLIKDYSSFDVKPKEMKTLQVEESQEIQKQDEGLILE